MIDWKSRISEDNKKIDISGMRRYILRYPEKPKTIKVYEYDVEMPEQPPVEECINYGLKDPKDRIFRKFEIPKQVLYPSRDFGRDNWTKSQIDDFIDLMWHVRINGCWFIIKDKPTYIPGTLLFKLNNCDIRNKFIYKHSDLEFFWFWMHCVRSYECKGMIDYKCRQLGDTENIITIMYEYGSRVRGMLNFMQSAINQPNIERVFDRLVNVHKNMIYYFKPMHQGKEDPKEELVFRYPTEMNTQKRIREKARQGKMVNESSSIDYKYPELNTRFQHGPTKENHFDGATDVGRAYLDEFGKPQRGFSPYEWIRVIVEALFSKITEKKTGLIMMTSTVDEITPETLEESELMWNDSDPNKRLSTGETVSGLFRIFRSVVARGKVDHWGFAKEEEILAEVTEKYEAMLSAGNVKGALSYIQKNPRTIEDVFVSANNQSQFHIENLVSREIQLNHSDIPKAVRGNLKWKDGIKDTEVIWEPNPNGRWIISKHPEDFGLRSNSKSLTISANKPGNIGYFAAGLDPIDQKTTLETEDNRSKLALTILRRLDPNVDGSEGLYYQHDDEIRGIRSGDPVDLGLHHETNRVVCTYCHRDQDIFDTFEDVLLTVVYFGTDFLPEKQKAGALQTYLRQRGYGMYVTELETSIKNYRGQGETEGVTATDKSFQDLFSYIETYTCKWANAIDHIELIRELKTMNYKNKGKRDLGVSFGWALYHSYMKTGVRINKEEVAKDAVYYTDNYV